MKFAFMVRSTDSKDGQTRRYQPAEPLRHPFHCIKALFSFQASSLKQPRTALDCRAVEAAVQDQAAKGELVQGSAVAVAIKTANKSGALVTRTAPTEPGGLCFGWSHNLAAIAPDSRQASRCIKNAIELNPNMIIPTETKNTARKWPQAEVSPP